MYEMFFFPLFFYFAGEISELAKNQFRRRISMSAWGTSHVERGNVVYPFQRYFIFVGQSIRANFQWRIFTIADSLPHLKWVEKCSSEELGNTLNLKGVCSINDMWFYILDYGWIHMSARAGKARLELKPLLLNTPNYN